MAAYPVEDLWTWRDLTRFLDADVLASAGLPLGPQGTSCHVVSGDPDEDAKTDTLTRQMTAYFPGPARTARFSPLSDVRLAALAAYRDRDRDRERGGGGSGERCSIFEGDESDTIEMLLKTHMCALPGHTHAHVCSRMLAYADVC